jgi:hypothetical protein
MHWFHKTERTQFKIAALVYCSLHCTDSGNMANLCRVSDLPGRRSLHSASSSQLLVPRIRCTIPLGHDLILQLAYTSGTVCPPTLLLPHPLQFSVSVREMKLREMIAFSCRRKPCLEIELLNMYYFYVNLTFT